MSRYVQQIAVEARRSGPVARQNRRDTGPLPGPGISHIVGVAVTLPSVGATYSLDDETGSGGSSLRRGASPAVIRSALLAEDQVAFDTAFSIALASARDTLDLTALFEMLERWRRVALLQQDPARFHAVARRAAELLTGSPCPNDEPLAVTRAKAGM